MKNRSLFLVSILLVFCIAVERPAPAQSEPEPAATQPECHPGVVAAIFIVVGGIIIGGIVKICKKCLPPQDPPPPPPAPPPPECALCSPTHPEWPCTNCPPIIPPIIVITAVVGTNNSSMSDISGYGWNDPRGFRYETLQTFRIATSTNLTAWSQCLSMTQWVSRATLLTVCYTNGVPASTNQVDLLADSACSGLIPVRVMSGTEPRRFFKVTP